MDNLLSFRIIEPAIMYEWRFIGTWEYGFNIEISNRL